MTTNREDFNNSEEERNDQNQETKPLAGEPNDSAAERKAGFIPQNEDERLPNLFARMQELKEDGQSKKEKGRFLFEEAAESQGTSGRAGRGLQTLVLLVLALLLGGGSYAFPTLRQHGRQLAELAGVKGSYQAVSGRMKVLEGKLEGWASRQDGMAERLSGFEKKLSSGLQTTRRRAEGFVAELGKKLEANLAVQARAAQDRMDQVLNQVQTNQESARIRFARLEEEIAGMRQEMAQQVARSQQSQQSHLFMTREVAGLRDKTLRNRTTLEELSANHDRERLDFEAAKGQRQEVAPGIHVTFKGNDVSYQRVKKGWLLLSEDGRILWIRDLNIQQPLIFYTQKDQRPYELVLTRVTDDDVIGYLLTPGKTPTLAADGRAAMSR